MRRLPILALLLLSACADEDGPPPPVANGTLGPWIPGPPMPVARANHASAVLGGDLVVLGGNRREAPGAPTFVRTDLVHAAMINEDGSLGAWREVARLPSPVSELAAAASDDTLYAIDGIYDDETKGGQVWAATRAADGTFGPFASLGPLPAGLRAIASEAWVVDDTLYVTSGRLPNDGDTLLLLAAPLGATPLVWTQLTIAPSPGWRGQPQYVLTGGAIHAVGGYLGGDAQVVADSQWARLDHGVATPVGQGPSLLAPTAAGEAIAVDDWAFLVGGKPMIVGAPGVPAVSAAGINADGSLDEWNASTPLPVGRTNHDLALGPTHLYLTGGSLDMGGLDTVYLAQVRFVAVEAQ